MPLRNAQSVLLIRIVRDAHPWSRSVMPTRDAIRNVASCCCPFLMLVRVPVRNAGPRCRTWLPLRDSTPGANPQCRSVDPKRDAIHGANPQCQSGVPTAMPLRDADQRGWSAMLIRDAYLCQSALSVRGAHP